GIGLVIASLMFMKEIGDLSAVGTTVSSLEDDNPWEGELDFPEQLRKEVFIKRLNGPLFFGSTSDFQQKAKLISDTASIIIFRMDDVPYMDQSGLSALDDVLVDLSARGKKVLLVGLAEQPSYMLRKSKVIPILIPEESLFTNFKECLASLTADSSDSPKLKFKSKKLTFRVKK
ncbi:MAG: STAS domain-containing protein, partial [Flavobacteriales bacterium]